MSDGFDLLARTMNPLKSDGFKLLAETMHPTLPTEEGLKVVTGAGSGGPCNLVDVDVPKIDRLNLEFGEAFRVPEAAVKLGLSESKVKELIRSKAIGHIREGGCVMITKSQIAAYLRSKELANGWVA